MNMTEEQKQNLLKMIESPNVDDINLAGSIIRHNLNLTDEHLEFLKVCEELLVKRRHFASSGETILKLLLSELTPQQVIPIDDWRMVFMDFGTGKDITKTGELKLKND